MECEKAVLAATAHQLWAEPTAYIVNTWYSLTKSVNQHEYSYQLQSSKLRFVVIPSISFVLAGFSSFQLLFAVPSLGNKFIM